MNIGILEPSDFSAIALSQLSKIGNVELFIGNDLHQFLNEKEVLFVRLNFDIDAKLLSLAPHLKFICSPTTGLNHIDLEYCQVKGINVLSLKGETDFLNTIRATPEHTLGLILALKRNYQSAFLNLENTNWDRNPYRGYEIYGSGIGIIGLGRVGKILASYLVNMGANVGFYDIDDSIDSGQLKRFATLTDLIEFNQTIVLCSSYIQENGSIINKEEIERLKGKYFINTARAELTDEMSLSKMALIGHFKGIAIDVIQHEQSTQVHLNTWLEAAKKFNVIITPHIGGATYNSMSRTEEFVVSKLINLIEN